MKPEILIEERGPEGRESTRISPWPINGQRGVGVIEVFHGLKFDLQCVGRIYLSGFNIEDGYRLSPDEARSFAEALNKAADLAEAGKEDRDGCK